MLKVFQRKNESNKTNQGFHAPRIPCYGTGSFPEFQLMGKIQNGGTHAFEEVDFYCFQISSKYDHINTHFCM